MKIRKILALGLAALTFTWKILDSYSNTWNFGTLAAGKSVTYTALYDLDYIPKGRDTLTIVTTNGGTSSAKASVRTLYTYTTHLKRNPLL